VNKEAVRFVKRGEFAERGVDVIDPGHGANR
jgi:hypothetical protein